MNRNRRTGYLKTRHVGPVPTKSDELLAKAHDLIKQYIDESGGCDHSVGICACADIRLLDEIKQHLRRD